MTAPQSNRNNLAFASIAVFASAILYFFSTGLNGSWMLLFVAPIPILFFANGASARLTFVISFLAYAIGGLNMVGYLRMLVPVPVIVVFILVPSIVFAFSIISARTATFRMKPWLAVFVFPAVWTTYEFLLSLISLNGTAGSIAYTQTDFLPLIQVASLTGIWGITFIVTLVPATIVVLWHTRRSGRETIRAASVPVILILFMLIFGSIRLAESNPNQSISVGLAACDTSIRYFGTTEQREALPVAEAYGHRAAELDGKGAEIVVLPEKFVGITQKYDSTVYSIFKATASRGRAIIIAGFNDIESPLSINKAVVFFPLDITLSYVKRYFVPGIETNYLQGNKPLMFQYDSLNIGVEICKDMDFPSWSREYGERDVKILFVPAWDFIVDGRLHSRMAIMRGVENGFSIVRCAQQGRLTVSDDKGRIVSEKTSGPETTMQSFVSPGTGKTLYSAMGDWFAWLNVIFVVAFVVWLSWRRPRTTAT